MSVVTATTPALSPVRDTISAIVRLALRRRRAAHPGVVDTAIPRLPVIHTTITGNERSDSSSWLGAPGLNCHPAPPNGNASSYIRVPRSRRSR